MHLLYVAVGRQQVRLLCGMHRSMRIHTADCAIVGTDTARLRFSGKGFTTVHYAWCMALWSGSAVVMHKHKATIKGVVGIEGDNLNGMHY